MPLLRATTVMGALDEPAFVRRLSMNLVVMALITGVALRVYRTAVLQFGWSNSWLWIAGTFLVGVTILFMMATLHLGNFPVRSWLWRAPLFALVEVVTEVSVSFGLTLAGLERIGSLTATVEDWQSSAIWVATLRLVGIPLFALVLAAVSTVVRLILLPRKPART